MNSILSVITQIGVYISFILPIIYFIGFAKNSKAYKIFTVYLLAIGIIQFLMYYIGVIYDEEVSNLFLFIYYFILQFIILSFFYFELLKKNIILYIMGLTLIFFGYQYYMDPSLYFRYNPTGAVISQGFIVIYSLLYFYKMLTEKKIFMILNMGIFFYLLSSMLIFASGNMVLNEKLSNDIPLFLRKLNVILYFIFQLLIIVEWWKNYSNMKKTVSE